MRFVVHGAGGVGGVVGARLFEHGHDVVLVARGAHGEAIRSDGLRVESPDGVVTLPIPCVGPPAEVDWRDDDVVLLAVQSQHTVAALAALPAGVPVVCVQNGVENERAALRLFDDVYGVCVMLPATRLVPGIVQAYSAPVTGILDVGRYPSGVDGRAEAIAAAFAGSSFASEPRPDIMRWKYAKLLMNLGNAVEAVCGPAARAGRLTGMACDEGVACLEAAGIDFVSEADDAARRGDLVRLRPIAGARREGGSTWQALTRSGGSVETDFLNGEVVLLGRMAGVPTPVNAVLQREARRLAAEGAPPGAMSEDEVLALAGRQPETGWP